MSSPQVKTPQVKQTNSNQTINNSSTQAMSWEAILKTPRIERQHIEYAINNAEQAPKLPVEFVYSQFADVKISYPTSIAISGIGGIIGAILALKHTTNIKYFITTEDVINASESSPLFLAKYSLERLSKIYQGTEVIILKLNEFEKIKLLLQNGGIYISGLPNELSIQIAQLAGFGRLWHYSPIQQKFFVF